MFDFDASKLLIVGVIALVFIPSKDLPRVLRQVGQFVSKARRMASEFQGQFMDAMKEADMADLRREAQKLAEIARVDVGLDHVTDLKSHVTSAIDGKPRSVEPRLAAMAADQTVLPETTSHETTPHETMDGAGLKDPNAELRRLTAAASDAHPIVSKEAPDTAMRDEDAHPKPIEHSAL